MFCKIVKDNPLSTSLLLLIDVYVNPLYFLHYYSILYLITKYLKTIIYIIKYCQRYPPYPITLSFTKALLELRPHMGAHGFGRLAYINY